ncbi:glycosyltransferase family 39 protein [Halobellus sp. GM3]|uniref:glycosyltransferase family 39 protein n=1 Tax=Halobellus sp. GM3 TaxID=3458410 RepID=UPI00403D83B6
MSADERRRPLGRRLRSTLSIDARDRPWLALALLPGLLAAGIYLATNPYAAYGAGLYAKIAAEIVANGYAPPAHIPGYTAGGVPFAYPPLQFYLFAAILDLGGDPVAVSRWLPSVGVLAASVPLYLLGRDVAGSRPAGAATAALAALNPQVLEWHISAGGVVRAFAFVYAMTAIYAGYRIFVSDANGATGPGGMLALGAVSFGLTALTHPSYTLFVVVSYLLFWLVRDRSLRGFRSGLAVGLGGALLASPWLAWVATTHGLDVFAAASGTHGGIGGGLVVLGGGFSAGIAAALIVAAYLLSRRRYLLSIWLVASMLVFRQPRFAYAVAAILVPVAAVELARRLAPTGPGGPLGLGRVRSLSAAPGFGADLGIDLTVDWRAATAVALVLAWTAISGAYVAYESTLVTDPSTPEFLDDEDVAAMAWIEAETDSDATFVALGDAAEWLPALTDRTLLVGPWGVEWVGAATFERQERAYEAVSTCQSAACVERVAGGVDGSPTHVYVPKGQYTIRGDAAAQFGTIERSFERSERWERVYENDGVVIYAAGENASR